MSHRIYQTDAFVMSSQPSREADLYLTLLTKEFGLIRATAQGSRYEKSKLRFSIQDLSFSSVSLVKGKSGWRLTNAFLYQNFSHHFSKENGGNNVIKMICQTFRLLERLIQGEEPNQKIFEILQNAFTYLGDNRLEQKELLDMECVLMLRILHNLGYIGNTEGINFYTTASTMEHSIIKEMNNDRAKALKEIHRALEESHL